MKLLLSLCLLIGFGAQAQEPYTLTVPFHKALKIVPETPCPLYDPCDVKFAPNPQFEPGSDPNCYGKVGCPNVTVANPLPQHELNTLAIATWAVMRRMVESGALKDLRTSEMVPIRWNDAPSISICWGAFSVEFPACFGDQKNVCTGKVSWVTARPYEVAYYRVAIRTDVDADTQRALVVDGVTNTALMFTNNPDKYNGPIGASVRLQLLGK